MFFVLSAPARAARAAPRLRISPRVLIFNTEYLPTIHTEGDKIQRPHETGHFEGDAFVGIEMVRYLPTSSWNCFFELAHSGLLRQILSVEKGGTR